MKFSDEEVKLLLEILNQLKYPPHSFKVVGDIIAKLNKETKPEEVTPEDPGSYDPNNPDKDKPVEAEVIP